MGDGEEEEAKNGLDGQVHALQRKSIAYSYCWRFTQGIR